MGYQPIIIEIIDPFEQKTKKIKKLSKEIDLNKLENFIQTQDIVSKERIIQAIHNLHIPAEAKAILVRILDITLIIGNFVVKIGKRIIEFILFLIQEYPNVTVGTLIGLTIGLIFNSIPILGSFISSVVTPLLIALGLGLGFLEDLKNKQIQSSLKQKLLLDIVDIEKQIRNHFSPLLYI